MQLFPQAQPFLQILQHAPLSTGVAFAPAPTPVGVATANPVPPPRNSPKASNIEYIHSGIELPYSQVLSCAPVLGGQVYIGYPQRRWSA